MMQNRILWLDNLKGFLILIVIFGHTILFSSNQGDTNIIYRYICSFWMAVFMFTSGFASYKPDLNISIIKKRFAQLIIPFVAWSVILCAINLDIHVENLILYPVNSVWFLWTLFIINSIVVLLVISAYKLNINEEFICLIFCCLLLILSKIIADNRIFALNLISIHLIYFLIGFHTRKYFEKVVKLPSIVWLIGGLLFVVMAYFNKGDYMPFGLPHFLHVVYDIICAIFSFSLFIPIFVRFCDYNVLHISKLGGADAWYLCNTHCYLFPIAKIF
jgi:nodulation acetyltransferase protein